MGRMWVNGFVVFVAVGILSAGCSSGKGNDARFGIDPAPAMRADGDIAQSFSNQKDQLSINKNALNKEFLLQVQKTDLLDANQFHSLRSRIVYFIEKDQKVYMMESPVGQVVSQDYDPKLILASFNITKEDDKNVTIDINGGLSRLYSQEDWYTSDGDGQQFSGKRVSNRIGQSFIDQLNVGANNSVVIKQITQIEGSPDEEQETNNEAVQYYLTPYQPNPNFVPKNNYSFDRFGYFETAPILRQGGESVIRAVKYDLEKPIVYAISANTPEDYKQAVRDGVLYWNKILGANKIQVINAPAGVSAPDFNYNVIQWMNWDKAGFAYADSEMDPRSGEILHSQIYLTSAFVVGGKSQLRAILRRLKTTVQNPAKVGKLKVQGFESMPGCDVENNAQMQADLQKILNQNLSDDQIKKLSQYYITAVVAHEVGHTLGLRHNFAGNTNASYNASEGDGIFEQFLKDGQTSALPSSSIMDYLNKEDMVMIGEQIQAGKLALDYDAKAIQHLYFDKNYDIKDVPAFCTDTQTAIYVDCQRFDSGKSYVDEAKSDVQMEISNLPNLLLENFILFKTSLPEDRQEQTYILKMVPNPSDIAKLILEPQSTLVKMLQKNYRIIKIDREFSYNSEMNQDDVLKAQDAFLASEFERLGGLQEVLEPFKQDRNLFVKDLSNKLDQVIASYKQGKGYAEKSYSLTDAEIGALKNISQKYFAQVFNELKNQQIKMFTDYLKGDIHDSDVSSTVSNFLLGESERIMISEDGSRTPEQIKVTKKEEKNNEMTLTLQLPNYEFSFEQRLAALALLKTQADLGAAVDSENIAVSFQQKGKLMSDYKEALKPVLDVLNGYGMELSQQSPAIVKWFLEEQRIEKAFQ